VGGGEPIRVHATVIRPPKDTVQFALPATAHFCDDRHSLLLQAASPLGNGVLVRLIYGDSLVAGDYKVITPGDTAARVAQVGLRYMVRDVAHSFLVDSGSAEFRPGRRDLDARVGGSGLEGGVRVRVAIEYADVPVPTDTVPCRSQP
jgi:hypothetical protein